VKKVALLPVFGVVVALLLLIPSDEGETMRFPLTIGVILLVGAATWAVLHITTRSSRARTRAIAGRLPGAPVLTVKVDADTLEHAAGAAGADQPPPGEFDLIGTVTGVELWRDESGPAIVLPWAEVRSIDVNPASLEQGAPLAIALFLESRPRHALRLLPQGRYGVLSPQVATVGGVVARLRELQTEAMQG